MHRRNWAVALMLAAGIAAAPGLAKTLKQDTGPAEYPPASYTGRQYVDSRGCVYIRAGYAGQVTWVPRVGRSRQVLCGFQPTFANAAPQPAPVASPAPVAKPAPQAPAPKRVVRTAPAPLAKPAPQPKQAVRTGAPACPGASALSSRYINDGSQYPVRCGPQAEDPRGAVIVRPGSRMAVSPGAMPVRPAPLQIPKGYKAAWTDDRLNPMRGIGTQRGAAQMALVWTDEVPRRLIDRSTGRDVTAQYPQLRYPYTDPGALRVSTKSAPAPAQPARAAGARYVQVGAFARPANAQATVARLRGMGLPVRQGTATVKGQPVQLIYAGPFADQASLTRAHAAIRRAGYSQAFLRK